MALSEREQRILEEIERQLAADDPRFVQRTERVAARRPSVPRLSVAVIGFVLGFVLLLGVALHLVVGLLGFGVMLLSVILAASAWRARTDATSGRETRDSDDRHTR